VIKKYYSKYLLYFVALLTVPACILNIGADLAGMGAVSHLLIPQVPSNLFVFLFAILIPASIVFFSYKSLEKIMKWLTLVLLSYFVVPFLVSQNLVEVFKATIIPQFQFSKEFISIFVALLGTTISPYLFFWEASQEVEEHELQSELHHHDPNKIGRGEIKQMRKDNLIGMFFSNLAMYFIILTAAVVLFKNGLTEISTVDQAAQALKPLAGDWAYFLFSIGVIGTGFLAIPVLAGACSYLLTETFNLPKGINKKFHEAKSFYFIIIISVLLGLGMNVLQIDPVQALIFTAIVYGVIAPILIGVILHICNNPKIMGIHKNGWLSNTFSILGLLLMSVAAIALLWTTFL
jgi:Mn2+/Fe2+ NRAMP family transporter